MSLQTDASYDAAYDATHDATYDAMPSSPKATQWQLFESFEKDASAAAVPCSFTKHKIIMHGGHVIPSKSNQDWVKTLVTQDNNAAVVVCDGNGKGKVVNYLKTVPWERILTSPNPIQHTRSLIESNVLNTRGDGSTFASVELLKNGFRCRWLGDSEILVFHNSTLCWRSRPHSSSDQNELTRLIKLGVKMTASHGLRAVNEKHITMIPNPYCVWAPAKYGGIAANKTAFTRGFGHTGLITTFDGEMQLIKFNKPGNWRAVVYTDGVGDVACDKTVQSFGDSSKTPLHIAETAHKKWNQPWQYLHPESCQCETCLSTKTRTLEETTTRIPNPDDVGVAVLEVNVTM